MQVGFNQCADLCCHPATPITNRRVSAALVAGGSPVCRAAHPVIWSQPTPALKQYLFFISNKRSKKQEENFHKCDALRCCWVASLPVFSLDSRGFPLNIKCTLWQLKRKSTNPTRPKFFCFSYQSMKILKIWID